MHPPRVALAIALLASPALAQQDGQQPAQPVAACAPRADIVAQLEKKYGETRRGAGLQNRGSVTEVFASTDTGTGFLFESLTVDNVVGAVQRAVSAMTQPSWGALRRRVMRLDHSWERPARRYARLYER